MTPIEAYESLEGYVQACGPSDKSPVWDALDALHDAVNAQDDLLDEAIAHLEESGDAGRWAAEALRMWRVDRAKGGA